jgi:hypothetical protein
VLRLALGASRSLQSFCRVLSHRADVGSGRGKAREESESGGREDLKFEDVSRGGDGRSLTISRIDVLIYLTNSPKMDQDMMDDGMGGYPSQQPYDDGSMMAHSQPKMLSVGRSLCSLVLLPAMVARGVDPNVRLCIAIATVTISRRYRQKSSSRRTSHEAELPPRACSLTSHSHVLLELASHHSPQHAHTFVFADLAPLSLPSCDLSAFPRSDPPYQRPRLHPGRYRIYGLLYRFRFVTLGLFASSHSSC